MGELKYKVEKILGSRQFYWAAIIFFVISAAWIALSANYPMAFDEDFHFGVIKIYSEQWLPFLAGQPEGANVHGALATDPSYLYHYLMSFPYRFFALFTDSQTAQVIYLRFINIAVITSAVVLFSKVLLRVGTPRALTSTAILLFALIPSVALLAGQINYDSLMMLGVAWTCWLVLGITDDLRRRKVDLKTFGLLAIVLLLGSLVKYAFLPVVLAVVVYLAAMLWRTFRGRGEALTRAIKRSYAGLSGGLKIGLLVFLFAAGGLFVQRYGLNTINYGNPVPDCSQVISVEACLEYGPWARNYQYAADRPQLDPSPIGYTRTWLQNMHYRMFFIIGGPPSHTNYPPVPLPSAAAVVILALGVTGLAFFWRETFRARPFLVFLLIMPVIYGAVLWADTYSQFLETGRPVAINGRYLIPFLLPLAAVFARSIGVALKPWKSVKIWAAAAAIVLFLQAGGVFSFVLRSDDSWYWPNNTVVLVNEAASVVFGPIMYEGPTRY